MNKNVIFITVDTLRKDYTEPIEEVLMRFGFINYENVIAPSSWTLPTHASFFTGLYPAFHGVHETKRIKIKKLSKSRDLLTYTLRERGFKNYLFTANYFITPFFGFKYFNYIVESSNDGIPNFFRLTPRDHSILNGLRGNTLGMTMLNLIKTGNSKLLIKTGLNYLLQKNKILRHVEKKIYSFVTGWPKDKGISQFIEKIRTMSISDSPFFMFVNLMEVHEPYSPIKDENIHKYIIQNLKTNYLDPDIVKLWKQKYPEEVKYVAKKLVELIGVLKSRNIFDNSLIIITSDHGQLLGEHNRLGHGTFLYDELIRVPLLIKYPKDLDIEITQNTLGYISLTKLKELVLNVLDNGLGTDSVLYSDVVFSESYGIAQGYDSKDISSEYEKKNIEQLEKYRIAIYYKNFKGIFNVTDWKFEEIISYNPNVEVTEDVVKHMKKEVIKFLKTVTVAKVPKIKL